MEKEITVEEPAMSGGYSAPEDIVADLMLQMEKQNEFTIRRFQDKDAEPVSAMIEETLRTTNSAEPSAPVGEKRTKAACLPYLCIRIIREKGLEEKSLKRWSGMNFS